MRRELVDWAKGQLQVATRAAGTIATQDAQGRVDSNGHGATADGPSSAAGFATASRGQFAFTDNGELPPHAPLQLVRLDRPLADHRASDPRLAGGPVKYDANVAADRGTAPADGALPNVAAGQPGRIDRVSAMQVHNRYLITESDEGVVVIDQHALHERILYEHLRAKVLGGALESQALLVPEPVDLSPAEAAAVLDAREVLARLGVTIAPFGGGTVLVSSYPAMLANVPPGEVLRDLVDRLLAGGKGPDRRDLLDELLHMISCKAAIKAGDRLSGDEIAALLTQRHLAQDTHHCPHGRPTSLVFTREELDRQFKRT